MDESKLTPPDRQRVIRLDAGALKQALRFLQFADKQIAKRDEPIGRRRVGDRLKGKGDG